MSKTIKNFFVCFSGVDGSGKTTQVEALIEEMKKNGIETKYVWNRFEGRMLTPFTAITKMIFFHRKGAIANPTDYCDTKKRLLKNCVLSVGYQYFLLFDYFFQILFRVRIPLIHGKNIVCDRYVYDIIADLSVDFNYSEERVKRMLKNLLYLFPKPDLIFLIDVPEEIAYQRKDDVPSIDYLKERRKVYLNIGKKYRMIILDGCKDLRKLKELVRKEVFEYIKGVP